MLQFVRKPVMARTLKDFLFEQACVSPALNSQHLVSACRFLLGMVQRLQSAVVSNTAIWTLRYLHPLNLSLSTDGGHAVLSLLSLAEKGAKQAHWHCLASWSMYV